MEFNGCSLDNLSCLGVDMAMVLTEQGDTDTTTDISTADDASDADDGGADADADADDDVDMGVWGGAGRSVALPLFGYSSARGDGSGIVDMAGIVVSTCCVLGVVAVTAGWSYVL